MVDTLSDALLILTAGNPKPAKRFLQFADRLRGAAYDRDDPAQLLGFIISMAAEAKGQIYQDLWALWASGQKKGGFFVEFGAANGVDLSNTWLMEKRMGWQGILAEPNPVFFDSLAAARSCTVSHKCVYSRSGERLEFLGTKNPEYSGLMEHESEEMRRKGGPTFEVETIALNDLLAEHEAPRVIDYMSIDTEGSELEILSAFDFDRWDVRAISVEHNYGPNRDGMHSLLADRGFRRQWTELSLWDDWYVRD
ncbi:MAG TPA: FkbM family methyltransferase [Caulobacteraceae bacterium]